MNRQLHSKQQAIRKLDRRNAVKNIDYDATSSPILAHTIDLAALRHTSFRVEGVDGDFDQICHSLGLSGPEDFAIPAAAWEARKSHSLTEPSSRGVNRRVSENIVSCESGDNRNLEKFRVPGSSTENVFDAVRHFDEVPCELGNNWNLKECWVPGSNQDNLFNTVGRLDKVSCEWANNQNSVSRELASNGNRDKLLQDKIRVMDYERNENRFISGKVRVKFRDCDEVTCELGDHQNLERFGINADDSSDTYETKAEVRESKTNANKFSELKKTEFAPAKIEVRVEKTNGNRDCDEEVRTSNGAGRNRTSVRSFRSGGGGIKGSRSPVLAPPPVMLPSKKTDDTSSSWDLLQSFGPQSDEDSGFCIVSSLQKKKMTTEDNEEAGGQRREADREWLGDIRVLSDSCLDTSEGKEDDSVDVMVEHLHFVSPSRQFKCTINSWQKGDFLGSGSFGTVYEGFTDDGIFFAVKEVSLLDQGDQGKQSIYQLEQEIFFLSQFKHENIVQYLGTDKDEGKLYIFLELVTQGSLASLYQTYNLQDSQVSAYTRQILNGLNYLHLRKVVHRDIKCANILVDVSGSVKLADFGLAKATNLNDVKSCKGTAFWMAPEVVNRKNHGYGLAADIWSLGCTVLEMLTRRIPYSHLEGMQALFRIGKGEPPPIPNSLSIEARDFISKCLQVNPDDRPTAAQLLDDPFIKRPLSTFSAPASPFHHGRKL